MELSVRVFAALLFLCNVSFFHDLTTNRIALRVSNEIEWAKNAKWNGSLKVTFDLMYNNWLAGAKNFVDVTVKLYQSNTFIYANFKQTGNHSFFPGLCVILPREKFTTNMLHFLWTEEKLLNGNKKNVAAFFAPKRIQSQCSL